MIFQRLWDEFQDHVPTLTEVVRTACTRKNQADMKQKNVQSVTAAITTVIGKCLGIYNKNLSALRTFYTFLLSDGGLTNIAMNRLAKLYDCTTHQSFLPKLNALSSRTNFDLQHWIAQKTEFGIVFDNVDVLVRPRMESSNKSNNMFHMVQAIAVKERVVAQHTDRGPLVLVDDLKPSHVVPSMIDYTNMKRMLVNEVMTIWSTIPALQRLKLPIESEKHTYSHLMSKRSELVSMK